MKDINVLLLCIIVFFCFLIENMIYKFLENIFFLDDIINELKKEEKEEVGLDDVDEFMVVVLKLIDEII